MKAFAFPCVHSEPPKHKYQRPVNLGQSCKLFEKIKESFEIEAIERDYAFTEIQKFSQLALTYVLGPVSFPA